MEATVRRNSRGRWMPFLIVSLLALGFSVLIVLQGDPTRPSFDPHAYPRGEKFLAVDYPFLNSIPISEDLTWVDATISTNAGNCWVLNVKSGQIQGELKNLSPLALDGRAQRVVGRSIKSDPPWWRQLFERTVRRVIRIPGPLRSDDDQFWIIDLTNGKAERFPMTAKWDPHYTAVPSPDGQRIYQIQMPNGATSTPLLLLDVTSKTISTNVLPGWPDGWWNNQEVLYKSSNGFALFNVGTAVAKPLVSTEKLREMIEANYLDAKPEAQSVGAFTVWNGASYQFYVADLHKKWSAESGYLARLEPDAPQLKMIDPDFEFHWSDHLDSTGRYYIYSGRQSGDYSSAVFLRDLQKGTERLLVPEDKGYFSIPNFYSNSVVFIRSNMLWKIDVNGKNLMRLFPPEC